MVNPVTDDHTALKTLYHPPNPSSASIDIVAIHGLGAHPDDTWIKSINSRSGEEPLCVNWLCEPSMLPEAVPTARIMRYGYKSQWFGDEKVEAGTTLISDVAKDLLKELEIERKMVPNRPLIFIAHSFGGLLLIKALRLSFESPRNWLNPFESTAGVLFLGTPFRGREGMTQSEMIERVLKHYMPDHVHGKSLDLAVPGNEYLEETVKQFLKTRDTNPIPLWCFYETHQSDQGRVVGGDEHWAVVVPRTSACLDPSKGIDEMALQRNHYNMNKFGKASEAAYRSVREVITKIASRSISIDTHKNSLLDEAYALICDKYYTANRLGIERLSGDLLPMDQCYINLAIVEQPGDNASGSNEGDTIHQSSPFSLFSRLRVEKPDEKVEITLPTVFSPRKAHNGQMRRPNRILIRGRAGVGKTTLCKKIVHNFIFGKMWHDLFDRVLWVPLRNLKLEERRRIAGYNFGHLFHHQYFSQHPEGDNLAKALWHTLEDTRSRTLFILDGLDEAPQDPDGDIFRFLQELLNQPSVIITSRPHTMLPPSIHLLDLELETIGFYPDQVEEYIQNTFSPKTADEIQSFLQERQLIQSLVRIPIQLDALCYTWDTFGSTAISQTMTTIYSAIEQSLWKKDAVKLEKRTQPQMQVARPSEISNSVKDEIYLLEVLAFTGMHNDVIEFEPTYRDVISNEFIHTETNLLLDEILARVSFLRTSDPSPKSQTQSYHFLHLTFQEYFAARYFVRQWKARQPLNCLTLSNGQKEDIKTAAFIGRYKYNARYNIMWRFITGLLNAEGDTETLRFFQTVEEEPRDLLGPTHQRLVIHCLSEVVPRNEMLTFTPFRRKLEDQLLQWVLFECNFRKVSQLAGEMDLPQEVLDEALQQMSKGLRSSLLESLETRVAIPSSVIDLSASWMENNVSKELTRTVLRMLLHRHEALPSRILRAMAARLKDEDKHIRQAAVKVLQSQPALPGEILLAVAARLEDEDEDVREAAVEVLQSQSALSREILLAVVARFEDKDEHIRRVAVKVLQSQPTLPGEILLAVVAWLEDKDEYIRQIAVKVLQSQLTLSEKILQAIAARFKDKDWYVRQMAVKALQSQSALPREILLAVTAQLEDEDKHIRQAAVKVLQSQPALSGEILLAVVARLEDEYWDVGEAAVKALQSQLALPEEILQAIAVQLEDEDWYVRQMAVKALQSQSALPREILLAVVARLEDEDWDVREAAVKTLQSQPALSEEILLAVVARFKNEDWYVRQVAVEALQSQPTLSREILQTVVARLEDEDKHVRWVAVEALQYQSVLTKEILQAIAARLEDEDKDIREAALEALQNQSVLPGEILLAIAARLEDKDKLVRRVAVGVLQSQPTLPGEILQTIAAWLEDKDEDVIQAALEALQYQSALPEEILLAAAARLEDKDEHVRWVAVRVLQSQPALTKEILQAIVAWLEDKDKDVRQVALEALQYQLALPREILQAIAARLEDEDKDIREAALEALQSRSALPEEILQAVAIHLKSKDKDVRQAAIEALQNQSALPEKILQAVAVQLEDKHKHIRQAAVKALQNQSALPLKILSPYIESLYRILVERSFVEHLSCYTAGGMSYLIVSDREIPLNGQQDLFRKAIREMQEELGIPLSSALGVEFMPSARHDSA